MPPAEHHTDIRDTRTELIHRRRPADRFVMIENATARDAQLTWTARGVLAELLSQPPGWRASADEMGRENMRARGRDGERVTRAAFRELRGVGYLHRGCHQGRARPVQHFPAPVQHAHPAVRHGRLPGLPRQRPRRPPCDPPLRTPLRKQT